MTWLVWIILRCECESEWWFVFLLQHHSRPKKGESGQLGGWLFWAVLVVVVVPLSTGCLSLFSEGGAVGQSVEERRKTVAELQAVFRATGFPFHIVPLEQVGALMYFGSFQDLPLKLCPDTLSRMSCALLREYAKCLSGSGPSQWSYNDSATVFPKNSQCLQSSCG